MEIEFKFCIPADRLDAVEAALRAGEVKRTRLQARYFDTAEHALAAQGVVLRLRKEGDRWVQTAKAAGHGVLQRLEHNVDLGSAGADAQVPQPDVQRHADTPVGERLAELLRAAGQPLRPTYGTDIWRLTRTIEHEGCTVELALDLGEIHAGEDEGEGKSARVAPVRELELELVSGPVHGLTALAQQWADAHGLWFSTVSKAEAGLRLLHGSTQMPAVKAQPPHYKAGSAAPDGRALLRAVVAACLAQILPNASEVAAGSDDADQIHQLRIGLRRLRTALRTLGPLAGPAAEGEAVWGDAWESALVTAFRALGELRDGEAVMGAVQAQLQAAGAPPVEAPAPGSGALPAAEVVRASALQTALVQLIGFCAEEEEVEEKENGDAKAPDAQEAALTHVRERLDKLHRQLRRAGRRFADLSSEERHTVRKRLKRLRYLAEFVAPLFGDKKSARYLDALRPAQDALGHYNDEVVAQAMLREWAAHDSAAWFGVGWLKAREADRVQACADALAAARKAEPFWHKAVKPKYREGK